MFESHLTNRSSHEETSITITTTKTVTTCTCWNLQVVHRLLEKQWYGRALPIGDRRQRSSEYQTRECSFT
jgi:hypothetical protein